MELHKPVKPYYVTVTGAKNNAGDFLIRKRGLDLFQLIRTDRDIVDLNSWSEITDEELEIVNGAQALILLGGPALRANMYPNIYKLRKNLDDIKVPIIMMGLGWKSPVGTWNDSYDYKFTQQSMKLLKKINNSGYVSSVRDYHTLNSLFNQGIDKVVMTGCPAYYSPQHFDVPVSELKLKKISFSLGVSFVESKGMETLMKDNILQIKEAYRDSELTVAFHHSLNKNELTKVYDNRNKHFESHQAFAKWLEQQDIPYIDLSGDAQSMINFYREQDLHIGYRVHAHIFMNSISKPSILLAEDGRGVATRRVIHAPVIKAYHDVYDYRNASYLEKFKEKLNLLEDRYFANKNTSSEILNTISYMKQVGINELNKPRDLINRNFHIMEAYLKQLP